MCAAAGFFDVLYYSLVRTEHLLHEDWIPYRISLLGELRHRSGVEVRRDQPLSDCGRSLRNIALRALWPGRGELRKDMDVEMIVSILDWTMERFQDALLTAELDPGLFRRQGEMPEKKEARIRQFLAVLRRAVGVASATLAPGRSEPRRIAVANLIAKPNVP